MTVGFEVIGDSGNILISQDYKNMQLVESGTVSPASGTYAGVSSFSRTGLVAPILFLSGPRRAMGYACKKSSGSTAFLIFADGASSAAVNYWIFDIATLIPSNGGLQVFTAAGELAFDSGAKTLRVIDQLPISSGSANTTKSYAAGASYAVAHVKFGIREVYLADQSRSFIGSSTPVGGITTDLFRQSPTIVGTVNQRDANILVADITNY